ncbi:hypothetical protein BS78_05G031100 [Paspalum vaginatum]|nr:hypothetical protein BS78_05G031100 [Paspalum vaginatum]
MVHLETMRFEMIFEANPFGCHGTIHPFTHSYVPGRILEGRHAGAKNSCKENEKLAGAMQRGYSSPSGRMSRYAGQKVKRVLETNLERNRKRVKRVETRLGRHS